MRIPQTPPNFAQLLAKTEFERIVKISGFRSLGTVDTTVPYLHWDKLRRYPPKDGMTHEEWWLAEKISRMGALLPIPLKDDQGKEFRFAVPGIIQEDLHKIDTGVGSTIGMADKIPTPQTRDRYVMRSLMEEAITSSQLEGAVTTREVAKEMIRTGRSPRDTSERMILNNYSTMQWVRSLKEEALTPEIVFQMHQRVTRGTLKNEDAAGRFRTEQEVVCVRDDYGVVYHNPPVAGELRERLDAMCDFANGKSPGFFVHPVLRAIMLHFWLAYDHPFVDGNGRTARALFYWSMLRARYWLFEFISISAILRKAPSKYLRSFLYTETDDNDLTYFIVAQTRVIRQAIVDLHSYIERKALEVSQLEQQIRALQFFNHRQADLIRHALKHPFHRYTIASHQRSHNVSYQTARGDLLELARRAVLEQKMRGRQLVFTVSVDVEERIRRLEGEPDSRSSQLPLS